VPVVLAVLVRRYLSGFHQPSICFVQHLPEGSWLPWRGSTRLTNEAATPAALGDTRCYEGLSLDVRCRKRLARSGCAAPNSLLFFYMQLTISHPSRDDDVACPVHVDSARYYRLGFRPAGGAESNVKVLRIIHKQLASSRLARSSHLCCGRHPDSPLDAAAAVASALPPYGPRVWVV